jgi:hypothetical protein
VVRCGGRLAAGSPASGAARSTGGQPEKLCPDGTARPAWLEDPHNMDWFDTDPIDDPCVRVCVLRDGWVDYRVDEGGEPLELLEVCGAELDEFLFACFGQGEAHDAAVVAVFPVAGDEAELLGAID